jgi:hypothetical protein
MQYIVLVKSENKIWLLLSDNKSIVSFHTPVEGTKWFEKAYQERHARSFEASMSACIHHLFFQPSIVEVPNIEFIDKNILSADRRVYRIGNVAGRMLVAETQPGAAEMWEKGSKPKLIQ